MTAITIAGIMPTSASSSIIADADTISRQEIIKMIYTLNRVIVAGVGVPIFTGCSGNGEPSPAGP